MPENRTELLDASLFVLAFDHRSVLRSLYTGITDSEMRSMKAVVANAVIETVAQVRTGDRIGLLIDEETGLAEIPRAQASGVLVSIPIERSGAPVFTIDRADYLERLEALHPEHAKALVFLNPDGDHYRSQLGDVREAFAILEDAGHRTILEFVVPPTTAQRAAVDGDELRFDAEVRPALVVRVIEDCYRLGIRPDLWKIEGLETAEAYALVAAVIADNDTESRSIVLGRGAEDSRVTGWLQLAAATPGFIGFAIGRSIWQEPLGEYFAHSITADAASDAIANRFAHYCEIFRTARTRPEVAVP
jgi:myo-inositol catabolism protein IolC